MATTTITREDIGRRIQAGRVLRGWSQRRMADELRRALDDESWTFRIVSHLETGQKKIEAHVLAVIAELQGQEIGWYYQPVLPYNAPAPAVGVNPRQSHSDHLAGVSRLSDRRRAPLRLVPGKAAA